MINWYLQTGKDSDIVKSVRIRLARNIADIPFVLKQTKEDSLKVIKDIENILPSLGYGLHLKKIKDMSNTEKLVYIEKHLISKEFAIEKNDIGAIAINDDENICITINDEDHIRIQVFSSGLELESVLNLAKEIDKKISERLNIAFNEKYGFLTASLEDVGTGCMVSAILHLPVLTITDNINQVLNVVNTFGINIRDEYGETTKIDGDIFEISIKQTINLTEENSIKNLKIIVNKIIEQERMARKYLAENSIELEDRVYRAYGIITNCRKISIEEFKNFISDVKLGVDLGIIKEITDKQVLEMQLYTNIGNMQEFLNKNIEINNQDIERANVIKLIINERR